MALSSFGAQHAGDGDETPIWQKKTTMLQPLKIKLSKSAARIALLCKGCKINGASP
jgi:hypothetical protein